MSPAGPSRAGVLVGLDIGTSSCKAVAVGADRRVVATAGHGYPLSTPAHGLAEQDPDDWWRAATACLDDLVAALPGGGADVRGIGLSGQMHGLVALDADHRVLRPAILWNDQRCAAECDAITEEVGGLDALVAATGNRMITGFTGPKIRWLREHEPAVWEQVAHVLLPKDLLRLRLTGALVTDPSDASGTGLYDVRAGRWAERVVAAAGLDPAALPEVRGSAEATGPLRPELAAAWGIDPDVQVWGGGGDAVVQTLATGLVRPGDIGITLGTAGIVAAVSDFCPPNDGGRLQLASYVVPGLFHLMGVSLNAAGALQWLRDTLAPVAPDLGFAELVDLARAVPPGSDGLLFAPWLAGERAPHDDPAASAAWVGLSGSHGLGHLVRSVMEGAVLNVREILEVLLAQGVPCERVVATGGATRAPAWLQLLADVLGREVVTLRGAAEGGAYAAALTAGIGAGTWVDVDDALAEPEVTGTHRPDPAAHATYERVFAAHRRLHADLAPARADVRAAGGAA